MFNYIRSDDGAEMIEIAPHSFVNREVLSLLGRVYANRDEVADQAAAPSSGHRGYTDET